MSGARVAEKQSANSRRRSELPRSMFPFFNVPKPEDIKVIELAHGTISYK